MQVARRADPRRLSRPAVHDHAGRGRNRVRHADGARAQHPARAGAAVLRRLPQQAAAAEQLPDHEPVLDGGLVRPVRRRARAVRPVPAAAEGLPVPHRQRSRTSPNDCPNPTRATPNPEPCNAELLRRRRSRVARRHQRRRQPLAGERLQQPVLDLRRPGRVAARGRSSARCASPTERRDRTSSARSTSTRCTRAATGPRRATSRGPSWAAAANVWPSAGGDSSTEAESAGMAVYAHELSHNLNIPDNYNNPFTAPFQRTASGMWDMMSRGSFNGPGGQHTRYHDPADPGLRAGRAAQHAQQALPELHHRQRPPAAQPRRPGPDAASPSPRSRRARSSRTAISRACA